MSNLRKVHDENSMDDIKEDIIKILEENLAAAKRGELLGIGIISVHIDKQIRTQARYRGARHLVLAGCEYLKYDICEDD